jgi:hypothetical protein
MPPAVDFEVAIYLNGLAVGQIQTREELNAGRYFRLKDDLVLHVQREKEIFGNDRILVADINGIPIKGSAGDPKEQMYVLAGLIIILALGNITIGICPYFMSYVKAVVGIDNLIFGGAISISRQYHQLGNAMHRVCTNMVACPD